MRRIELPKLSHGPSSARTRYGTRAVAAMPEPMNTTNNSITWINGSPSQNGQPYNPLNDPANYNTAGTYTPNQAYINPTMPAWAGDPNKPQAPYPYNFTTYPNGSMIMNP
jgi:hypothetical protein